MRHRIKSGKIGSFNPERVEVPEELQEEQALSSEVEEIFEEDTAFSDSDEALAAMEFYDTPDELMGNSVTFQLAEGNAGFLSSFNT